MLKTLTAAAIAEYERDGFYFPIPVLGAEEVQRYRSALEAFERDNGGPLRGPMMFKTHLLFRWVDELIRHPKVLDAVEDILGPNLLAWNTHFFIKEPGDERYVAWHQDLTYWNLDPAEALTAWIALSPSTPKSGAMRMVPGTHTREVVPHLDTWKKGAMLTRGQEIAVEVDEDKAIDVTLRPGEMSLHHQKIFHASPANRADDRRIGLAIRYIPTHVRQVVIDDDSAALVRGTDEYGHFQLEPRPERDMDPALVAMQAEAAERQARILYHGTDRPTFRADI
ncbi:MAG: phytanoyl-CoA dioxygenase family protein [Azospirillaceae bacterium]